MTLLLCIYLVVGITGIGMGTSFVIRHIRCSYTARSTYRDSAAGIVLGFVIGALSLIVGGFSPVVDVLASCLFGLAVTVIASFDPTP